MESTRVRTVRTGWNVIQSARVVGNRPNLATLYMHTVKTSKLLNMYTILAGSKLIELCSSENWANAV